VLAFKELLNRLNPRSVEKVMIVLLKLRRMDQNWHVYVLASFGNSIVGIEFGVQNERFLGFPKISILGF